MKLFLIGFMGSGKTHWGQLLAAKMDLPFFDLDAVIEQREKASITDIFTERGEEAFRYIEKEVLEKLVGAHKDFIISCGGGTPCFFNNIGFMKQKGLVIWLNTQIDTLVNRLLKQKNSRPLLKKLADTELKQYIISKILRRRLYYEQADIMVHEETLSVDTFAEIIANA